MPNKIKQVFPLGFPWETADPFLFCVYHEDFFPHGNNELGPDTPLTGRSIGNDFTIKDGWRMYHGDVVPGFPAHPHRGFETVTVVRRGVVDHADSLGAAGRNSSGDTQWLTAGKGVQHSEMFPLLREQQDNTLELFQIWLNLPASGKMVEPYFTMFWKEDTPVVESTDENGAGTRVDIIAGALQDNMPPAPPPDSWAADQKNDVAIWVISMEAGAHWQLPATSSGINRRLYYYKGQNLTIGDGLFTPGHGFVMAADTEATIVNGEQSSQLLLLQGKPIAEQVAHYGPFVMNTRQELEQAFRDYQQTRFGGWPWPRADQVFPRDKGRFARYTDGHEEEKAFS